VGPPKNKEKTEQKFETKEEESEKFAVVLVGDKEYDQGHVVKVGREEGAEEGREGKLCYYIKNTASQYMEKGVGREG